MDNLKENKSIWFLYFYYYVLLIPLWLIALLFANKFSFYLRIHSLLGLPVIALGLNPILASFITLNKIKQQDILIHHKKIIYPILITYFLSTLVLLSPWIYSFVQTKYYEKSDQKIVESINKEAAKEKRVFLKVINYSNEVDLNSSKWVQFVIRLEAKIPEGYFFDDIKDFLSRIKFNRDTVIEVKTIIIPKNYSNYNDQSQFYLQFFYDANKGEITR